MDSRKVIVETVDIDGKPLKLAIIRPGNRIGQEANMAYNLRMASLIRKGSQNSADRLLLRAELEEYLEKTGVWTLKDALEVENLALQIRAHELLLKKGGMTDIEGRDLAIEMASKRQMIMEKHAKRQQFDSTTVESQAENFRFEFLLVNCLVVEETGVKFLKNHDEYVDRQDETAVMDGAKTLANMIYGLESNIHDHMFEMRWLKEAKFIDDDGRYISKDGVMTDQGGRRVNKDGRYINEAGEMVDTFGRLVDEHGNLLVEVSKPFVDSETGEDVIICGIGVKPKSEKKKKTSKSATQSKKSKKRKVAAQSSD